MRHTLKCSFLPLEKQKVFSYVVLVTLFVFLNPEDPHCLLHIIPGYIFMFTIRCLEAAPPKSENLVVLIWLESAFYPRFTRLAEHSPDGSVAPESNTSTFVTARSDGADIPVRDATTVNVADAEVVSSQMSMFRDIPSSLLSDASTGIVQDIKTFLAKPVAIQTGVLSTTDTVSTFTGVDVPYDVIQQTPFLDKIRGFVGIRATVVFRLQVNANRFQQGRYMLAWIPVGGALGTSAKTTGWIKAHTHSLTQRTQLPHVELDVNCDTSCTLVVPYVSSFSYFPVNSANSRYGSNGTVVIYPYSPLVAPTGSSTASYTLWVHFEDVILVAPTVPQSGRMLSLRKPKMHSEQEQQNEGVGPIGSALTKISKAGSVLSQVPLLSAFAQPVSWAADIASQAAYIFGWSKPSNLEHTSRMRQEIFPYNCSVEAADNAQPLSLFSRNAVEHCPGFSGTDIDELDFSNFLTIPSYIATVNWTTSSAAAASIYALPLSPASMVVTTSTSSNTVYNHTPVSFTQDLFTQWRGSFVVTFKFVKTEFHSGRLMFVYIPYTNAVGTPTVTYASTAYLHREIIDIRECNEVSFTVPYVSVVPYLNYNDIMGYLNIFVVDPLVAPSSVSTSVKILVEVSAAPDMEFAIPRFWNNSTVMNTTPQSGGFTSLKQTPDPCVSTRSTIGGSSMISDDNMSSRTCVGEKITSFRQLLKVPTGGFYTGTPVTGDIYYNVIPYAIPCADIPTTVVTYTTVRNDLIAILSTFFAVSRGGVRLRAFYDVGSPVTANQLVYPYVTNLGSSFNSVEWAYSAASDFNGLNINGAYTHQLCQPQDVSKIGGFDIQVPQYHSQYVRSNADHITYSTSGYTTQLAGGATKFGVSVKGTDNSTKTIRILRAAADDFNLGLFVSIPPMVYQTI